jgi:SAM-dependent methyltransferase
MSVSTAATLDAYDTLAPVYDALTAQHAYEPWLASLETLARELGVTGRRVLDVACGTGKSFAPLLERGYDVTACDGSAQMAARARQRAGGRADVHVADITALPCFGAFDVVLCLDDVLNHLLDAGDVARALSGMGANLAPGGVLLFDVNTRLAYADGRDVIREDGETLVAWRGSAVAPPAEGGTVDVEIDIFASAGDDLWRRVTCGWRHRHYPIEQLHGLIEDAGLRVHAIRGQRRGGVLEPFTAERDHRKVVIAAGL